MTTRERSTDSVAAEVTRLSALDFPRTLRHLARLALLACSLPLAPGALLAQPGPHDLELARDPAIVTTRAPAAREFIGLLDGFRDGRLHLRNAISGGEVGYSFTPAEIARLKMPGAAFETQIAELWDRGDLEGALPLLEALTRQRLRYLPALQESHRRPLIQYILAHTRVGNPLSALGTLQQLRPFVTTAAERTALRDAELAAHVQLGQAAEIRRLANAWCDDSDPAGASALGWKLLARLAYDEGDFAAARDTALIPIVYSGHLPMEGLDACYALAIAAARRLGDTAHAAALEHEAAERKISVPPRLSSR